MPARRAPLRWLLLPIVIACSSIAAADEGAAAQSFKAGEAAYARGDFSAAAAAFERAYADKPHAVARYNAALAWEGAGDLARAADAYASALSRGELGEKQAKDASSRLARLDRQLGVLDVTGPAGATASVGHESGLATPFRVRLAPGVHRVELVHPSGERASQEVRVSAGATAAVSFVTVPSASPKTEAAPTPASPQAPSAPQPEPSPAGGERAGGAQKTLGWVVLGASAVVVGGSLFAGSRALAARDQYDASDHTDLDAHDRAASLRALTNVGLAVGGGLALGGAVLLLTAPSRNDPVSLRLGPSSIALGGRF